MIIISDRLRRPAEVERDELRKQLAEAKAEIERLKSEHEDSLRRAKDNAVSLSNTVTKQASELFAKDALIEQMRELLQLKNAILGHCRFATYPPKKIIEKLEKIEAALSAAERGWE